ncbi:unnamed protein product [Allacma fusca]|uniref:SHSP domain-containing protein n=1 Tax=Allacma fusca TaxID=39272 RepID=A0A8J2NXV1_9HEXA|nr:unnamed protein product [Allacma fusca]
MFPSQRAQYIFRVPSGSQTQDGATNENISAERVDTTRNIPGTTSKIEIRHTKPSTSTTNPLSKNSSINYLSKVNRRVTFNASTFKSFDVNDVPSEALLGEQSALSTISTASESTPSASTNVNEIFGQVAIQALCNRGSVVNILGVDQCMCQSRVKEVDAEELIRLQELDPETQKSELCRLMIQLVEDQADKNAELLEVQAQQKLFVVKPVKSPKVKHIICVGGRTLDGREIPVGSFPNSFAEIKDLNDLRKDPPGFKRYTAKFDMRGFRDEEISLTNERNILRVTGTRKKTGRTSEKQIVEEVLLPPGVYADTLKIGRSAKDYSLMGNSSSGIISYTYS